MKPANKRRASPRDFQGSPPESASTSEEDIRVRLGELHIRQQDFRRHGQDSLGVDHAGLTTMIHLAHVGTATPTSLAGVLESSTAATSLVLNRLEASGHVSRTPHPTDRRKVIVAPAPASVAAARTVVAPVMDGIARLTADLTPQERDTVSRFLQGVIDVYDNVLTNPRSRPSGARQ